jgi:hypothetical protein
MRTDEQLQSAMRRPNLPWPDETGAWDRFLRRRRQRAVRGVVATCLVAVVGVVGIRALPLGGGDDELGGPAAGAPRSYVVSVLDAKTTASGVALMGPPTPTRRLVRVDAASGRPVEVLTDRLRETVIWWQLLDDGSVVADVMPPGATEQPCSTHLKQRRPDGRWVDLGTIPGSYRELAVSPDGRLLAAAIPLCQPPQPLEQDGGDLMWIYQIGAKIAARPLAQVRLGSRIVGVPVSVSFSSDSRRVAVTNTGEVILVDLAGHTASARTVGRAPYDTCSLFDGRFGPDPTRLLVLQEDCQKPPLPKNYKNTMWLAELDLTSGRWRQLTQFGDHVRGADYDASRKQLLVATGVAGPMANSPPSTVTLFDWDGTTPRQLRRPSLSGFDPTNVQW